MSGGFVQYFRLFFVDEFIYQSRQCLIFLSDFGLRKLQTTLFSATYDLSRSARRTQSY